MKKTALAILMALSASTAFAAPEAGTTEGASTLASGEVAVGVGAAAAATVVAVAATDSDSTTTTATTTSNSN
ncbi:hypothetical protein [Vibrio natriegens]|jgi:uncharacterized protein YdeI (BOF family)|uniref:Uncharacterized protein n=1 Tax=Vibrio natriegens NBRC 15636 = ATCC 14048 = DSM 759 TaxID=1219067 RepID=A0AAN0Y046_VIBNA|nr:hypothetical protein [Vibrio natriegens]KAA5737413.1 hypothetical protein F3G21_20950 [Acinetobacter baumannii]MCE1635976.1 hypothetical protein [Enterobacter hormaechei]ALR16718.1 membrane protein [Vibrio natriegens NBRC 15636 = ATCC 14048 = DSM 759]ANQ11416.1 hypothetical protein BA890_00995 [Vibrio natriegens NBRC 15636 = ATCC 14048 = DSM 759]EPM38980.1 membrane protein [Vibrio natriegens NBRC 15636 = ATCC 14048 = DSM 759]